MRFTKLILIVFLVALSCSCGTNKTAEPSQENPQITDAVVSAEPPAELPEGFYPNMRTLGRGDFSYMTLKNDELLLDETSDTLPMFVDVVSFKKHIDDTSIILYITLRNLPAVYKINKSSLPGW